MSKRPRFPELDLLRFLAACAVMMFHYTFRGPRDHVWQGSFPTLSQIFKYGYLGVDVFFILSGFVILLTAYEKDALSFGIARIVRLYPAYWICVTLTAVAILLAGNAHNPVTPFQYLANLTMAHSYFGIRDVSGVYWTLAVELKFYFLIFLMLAFRQAHRIAFLLGLWLAASIFLSFGEPHGIARFFLFPEWSSYFIAGAMLFLVHREGLSPYKVAVILGCYGLSIAHATRMLPVDGTSSGLQVSAPVLIVLITMFYLVFITIALRSRIQVGRIEQTEVPKAHSTAAGHRWQFLYLLGLITYPLYLIHQDIGYILLRLAPSGLNRYLALGAVCSLAIVLSLLIHLGPEKWLAHRLKSLLASVRKIGCLAAARTVERARGLRVKPWLTAGQAVVPEQAHCSPPPMPTEEGSPAAEP